MEVLSSRVPDASIAATLLQLQHPQNHVPDSNSPAYLQQSQQMREDEFPSPATTSSSNYGSRKTEAQFLQPFTESPDLCSSTSTLKKKRGDFELNVQKSLDVVSKGLVSLEEAHAYFGAFFQGCVSFSSPERRAKAESSSG